MVVTLEIGYGLVGAICLSGACVGIGGTEVAKCNHRRDADIDGI